MTRTKNTIAASFAALLIGGLLMNPASAAVKWSDISAVTHDSAAATLNVDAGRADQFSRADLSSVTHKAVAAGTKPITKASGKNFSRNDISAVTHN